MTDAASESAIGNEPASDCDAACYYLDRREVARAADAPYLDFKQPYLRGQNQSQLLYVKEQGNQDVHDFLARRLYDMTAEIIMSLLIMDDATRNAELFAKSANVYVRMTEEDVCAKAYYVMHFSEADLASFRAE